PEIDKPSALFGSDLNWESPLRISACLCGSAVNEFVKSSNRRDAEGTPRTLRRNHGITLYLCSTSRSTYFAMTSTSRFTPSPGFRCDRLVTSQVLGMIAISK